MYTAIPIKFYNEVYDVRKNVQIQKMKRVYALCRIFEDMKMVGQEVLTKLVTLEKYEFFVPNPKKIC